VRVRHGMPHFGGFVLIILNQGFTINGVFPPEHSLRIHSGNWNVPGQLLIRTPKGGNKPKSLLHETSIMDVRLELPDRNDMTIKENLRIMTLPASLISCVPGYYSNNVIEARTALSMVSDASQILHKLFKGGHSTIAGRLAGAFRNIGKNIIADNIIEAMRSAGYTITENDPFKEKPAIHFSDNERSPYVNRIRMYWADMRDIVLKKLSASSLSPAGHR